MPHKYDNTKRLKILISQVKALEKNVNRAMSDTASAPVNRYVAFKLYAEAYNNLAQYTEELLDYPPNSLSRMNTAVMKSPDNTRLGKQKYILEAVAFNTSLLLAHLENETDFAEDECANIVNFIKSKLRPAIHSLPEKEVIIQNAIEVLLLGRDLEKGIDYDRESGKFEFSGKEYIPDFILPKMNLCIEVKLLRTGKKSSIIDEINADITAYSTKYDRLLFVVYDLGVIRDESEFRRDIENAGANIKVLIVKH